jgi:ABC-type phosphate transport system permease subunit
MGSLIVPPSRAERQNKRVIIIDRLVMLSVQPDGAQTYVTRVLASDEADADGNRVGVTVPIVGGLSATLASLAETVPLAYGAAWAVAVEALTE